MSNIEKIIEKLMCIRVYQFLTEINIIYDLKFVLRQNFFTAHTLINLTENIRQALDEGYIGCGIIVDLEKAFDTVDHQILSAISTVFQMTGLDLIFLIVSSMFL